VCKFGLFSHKWAIFKREWNERFKGPQVPKKTQFRHERLEYKIFLFSEPLKGSKLLKIFTISLTFRFDKLWHLSKSVHTGENSQILTVSNKKKFYLGKIVVYLTSSYWALYGMSGPVENASETSVLKAHRRKFSNSDSVEQKIWFFWYYNQLVDKFTIIIYEGYKKVHMYFYSRAVLSLPRCYAKSANL
jgi:hypothetical protein